MLIALIYFVGLTPTVAYATPVCGSISECAELASETSDNIAEIMGRENELSEDIADLNAEITTMRAEIESLELAIASTVIELTNLQDDMAENRELLEATEEEIEDLLEAIGARMRVTQQIESVNPVIMIFTESEDLVDIIAQIRFFNRIAEYDADVMDQLIEWLDIYDTIIEELAIQVEVHADMQASLEVQQNELLTAQFDLIFLEGEIREELYQLGLERMSEEDMLIAAEEAQLIFEQSPPPLTTTGTTTASPGNLANNSGMTHPMPAGRGNVMSEFGMRTLGGSTHMHWGIDWAAPGFPPILAAASGTVVRNSYNAGGWGWYVIIAHMIDGHRVDTLYAHFHYRSPLEANTVVAQGDVIGTQGNTGFSFGAHLHFEVHPGGFGIGNAVDPRGWIPNP